ncbi:MAG: hypothetical protein JKY60_09130, partial [Kordiimonadaceae bacterium]|nr:hypothetical protein [Kordiimonadaceae bacterium]
MYRLKSLSVSAVFFLLIACGSPSENVIAVEEISERYVKLVLAVGAHEPGYVDAYYGPAEWQEAVEANKPTLDVLQKEANDLQWALTSHRSRVSDPVQQQRLRFLSKQLTAVEARVRMIGGEKFTFDEETKLLFDAVVPPVDQADLDKSLAALDGLIEGEGTLQERFIRFNDAYTIPTDKLESVFAAAIQACKAETEKFIDLPEGERFTSEFVTDKPWSGYNWYQGNSVSLIQVNTDLPSLIGSAVNLGCHEGYPGHHVFNAMLEANLVNDRGWVEFSVYPLYSPQSLLAEGTASYGRFMAFPGDAQTKFEAEVLY